MIMALFISLTKIIIALNSELSFFQQKCAVNMQKRLVSKKSFLSLLFCGYYPREVTTQERVMLARLRYFEPTLFCS